MYSCHICNDSLLEGGIGAKKEDALEELELIEKEDEEPGGEAQQVGAVTEHSLPRPASVTT